MRRTPVTFRIGLVALLLFALAPGRLSAQADCLACHADKGLQDAAGHNISATNNTNRQRFIDLIASVLHWCRAHDGQRAGALRLNDDLSFGGCGALL